MMLDLIADLAQLSRPELQSYWLKLAETHLCVFWLASIWVLQSDSCLFDVVAHILCIYSSFYYNVF